MVRKRTLVAHLLPLAALLHRALALPSSPDPASRFSLSHISIAELTGLLDAGALTSHELTSLYLARIAEVNDALRAVIEADPSALAVASQRDYERARDPGHRGPLHGIPILIKDNFAVGPLFSSPNDPAAMLTGAGSTCLAHAAGRPAADAEVVARLRGAGAVVLGKTNLDELSGIRGVGLPHGWSPRGGQAVGPYVERQTPCGSSGGSAVAAALGLAAAALGTETAGSITCPAWTNNVVGIKPTVGLASRRGIVPVTPRQDTPGPLARSVADAAVLLDAIAGRDPADNWTLAQPWGDGHRPNYASPAVLDPDALRGKRIGAFWIDEDAFGARYFPNWDLIRDVFDAAIADIEGAGAEVVRLDAAALLPPRGHTDAPPSAKDLVHWVIGNMTTYAVPDGKEALEAYLADLLPPSPRNNASDIRTLQDLLRCIETDPRERAHDVDYSYVAAMAGLPDDTTAGSAEAWAAYVTATNLTRDAIVRRVTAAQDLDALVMFPDLAIILASAAGLPVVTVPMGALGVDAATRTGPAVAADPVVETAPGFPLGISFVADRWSEETLVACAFAYEQASRRRRELRPHVEPVSDLDLAWSRVRELV